MTHPPDNRKKNRVVSRYISRYRCWETQPVQAIIQHCTIVNVKGPMVRISRRTLQLRAAHRVREIREEQGAGLANTEDVMASRTQWASGPGNTQKRVQLVVGIKKF